MDRIPWYQLFAILVAAMVTGSNGAVMSVDLGNEWIKVAIVSPGKPMEVALNTDSSRKTPLIVAFRNGERHFGEAALTTATRFPEKSYTYLLDVIGKKMDSPLVQTYQERFSYLNMTGDPVKNTVIFNHPEGDSFTPEELLGMIFEKCRTYAEIAVGDGAKISEVVITIPPYLSQSEKRAILTSASLAGLKVLQLINSNTAVALNYGVFRIKDFNESTPSHILFYDMGSTSTIASVASYQVIKTKEKGFLERIPTLTMAGVGFDRTLGGFEMQLRLRDELVKKFADQRKVSIDKIKSNHRAMSKLLKEASRVKKILSANTETNARIENVMDDLDLKVEVTRSDFESLCADLLGDRLEKPVRDALTMSGLSLADIDQVILFGGNTRVPKVQDVLTSVVGGKPLGKSINSDEAAALGAVYQAAYLGKGFKVKQFTIKDINLYPIQVEFSRAIESEDGTSAVGPKVVKSMQRLLFGRGNVFPNKKVLTFSKHIDDFDFFVNYGDLKSILSKQELAMIGSSNITRASVTGVKEAYGKHSADGNKESKGVKAHFKLDESGILLLDSIEATFEVKVEENVTASDSNVVTDTIANLGKTFSQFFSSQKIADLEGNVEDGIPDAPKTNETDVNSTTADALPSDSSDLKNGSANQEFPKNEIPKVEIPKNGSNEVNGTAETVTRKEVRLKTIKEPLGFTIETVDVISGGVEELTESKKKLKELRIKDEERFKHDSLRNSLESFIAETRMKLTETEFESASTEPERESILNQLNQASEWLEYESEGAKTEDLQSKLSALKTASSGMFDRVREHRERPEAMKALKDMLNISSLFLDTAKNMTEEQQIFTEIELKTLDVLVTETTEWISVSTVEQKKVSLSSPPVVTIKQIAEKISNLDREVKYMVNKLKITPPKKPVTEPPPPAEEVEEENVSAEENEPSSGEEGADEGVSSKNQSDGSSSKRGDDSKIESGSSADSGGSSATDGQGDQEHSKSGKQVRVRKGEESSSKKRRKKGKDEKELHSEL